MHAKQLALLLALAMTTAPAAQTRVMPLGDSITEAETPHASYRYFLWKELESQGYCIDFVGSQTGVYNGPPRFSDFDQHHEGHWGWRADQILASVRTWATAANPQVLLMHLGTNDIWQGQSIGSTTAELGAIIDEVRAVNASVEVLIAQIIPLSDPNIPVGALNAAIVVLAAAKTTPASPVIVVDQNTGFDPVADTYDGVHPNETGERKMAAQWFGSLAQRLTRCRAAYWTFGAGCPGSAGTPVLAAVGTQRPQLNTAFTVALSTLPANANVSGVLGFSDAAWNGLPLPFDLSVIGMVGCQLLVGMDLIVPLSNQAGIARWTLSIPGDASFVGVQFFQQGLVLEPGANPLGVLSSNAGAGWINAQ